MAGSLSEELIILILQFLNEEKFKEAAHMLEKESGVFFSMKYFQDLVLGGQFDEAEQYLSGFTKVDSNNFSRKTYFEIRKQKYLESLDKRDRDKAVDVLTKELKYFATENENLFKDITYLLSLDNFRENRQLSTYGDTKTTRKAMMVELKKLIEANPHFVGKLEFPDFANLRLRTLINQSLNWQHSNCPNRSKVPDIRTLLVDHSCRNSSDPHIELATSSQLAVSAQNTEGFIPWSSNGAFRPPLNPWLATFSSMSHPVVSGEGVGLGGPANLAAMSKGLGDSDSMSMARLLAFPDRTMLPGTSLSTITDFQSNATEGLPKTVARTMNQSSVPTSMDFHPFLQTFLLVGTNVGEVSLWDVISGEKLVSRNFQVWDLGTCSMPLKAYLIEGSSFSIRRIVWSSDGSVFGVAYSKHMIQLYAYYGGNYIQPHLEIDAHVGAVNDLAFCNAKMEAAFVTCGDDMTIKVWTVLTGARLYTFEGHEAAVHSVCPHSKENVHFIFSTSVDGKIKAWLYDTMGSRVDYTAPGGACMTMAYSADGKRLFSCGTTEEGETHLVEWNEIQGSVKRTYQGFHKQSLGSVQFDISKNRYLAAGDDYSIKFWDMDHCMLLATVDAEGGLPACPRIRFNKEGSLLAVAANDHKIKILATVDGLRLMGTQETHSLIVSRPASDAPARNDDIEMEDIRARSAEEVNPARAGKLINKISAPDQFRSLKLSADVEVDEISRLSYTNSANGILALASKGIHLLWKWPQANLNFNGKATTKVTPLFTVPASGMLMTNDVIKGSNDDTLPCFALSKNDSYLMSASGGKISLFNMTTSKTMTTFLPPPPVATCFTFHPQDNNIAAIGMDDFTIHIYNVRLSQVGTRLNGHSKRITGLAFSHQLNILVSAGADAEIVVWECGRWESKKKFFLLTPGETRRIARSDTQVQFSKDQIHLLAANGTQLAIYDMRKLEFIKQFVAIEVPSAISHATFSCDGQLVYCSLLDGTVRIFGAPNLEIQCQINPTAYLPSDGRSPAHPLAVAAHPRDPNQFAMGLANGSVYICEPLESEGKWDVA
ncbi:topless-related protein 1-like isoform X1 [Herrania umbratica]|uniref:Topless-related protein 1-like isoform X1 n=1 Tax=Herrania umbratica TaxID=108875 RepID=A0A6J0ZLN3_9ROSI|nr:topless-related protein 1-like isoform X1 [Herrania umbratica]